MIWRVWHRSRAGRNSSSQTNCRFRSVIRERRQRGDILGAETEGRYPGSGGREEGGRDLEAVFYANINL